jgi:ATP-binding cassette, subfamily B, bacterial PglK
LNNYIKKIFYILDSDRKKLPKLVLFFLAVSMLDLAGLILIAPYISLAFDPQTFQQSELFGQISLFLGLPSEQKPLLVILGLLLLLIFVTKGISGVWINYKIILFSRDQQVRLRSLLMQSYQSLPYTTYLNRNSSEYIFSIQVLTGNFGGVLMSMLRMLSDLIIALVILVLLAITHGWALLFLLGFLSLIILSYYLLTRKKLNYFGRQSNIAATQLVKGIHEGIEGFKEIRVLGRENFFYQKVVGAATTESIFAAKSEMISSIPRYLLEVFIVNFVVFLVIGAILLDYDMILILPMLGMFGVAALRLLPISNAMSSSLVQLRYSDDAITKLYNDLKDFGNTKKSLTYDSNHTDDSVFKNLTINKISFNYPNQKVSALTNLSITINAGESIGFIGPSGAGKTTLVDVLLGLLEPQNGEIFYNDEKLIESMAFWHSKVAYLPQQVFLIDDTLRRNIALGIEDSDIDDARLNEAIRQSSLLEIVNQLPEGIETIIGERGVRLSGGQRQRVAIARAFYYDKSVFIMDESTSALDNETEREIVKEIKLLKGKKTIIVIAHRHSTVQYCDLIYRLEKGRIIEVGKPDKIL